MNNGVCGSNANSASNAWMCGSVEGANPKDKAAGWMPAVGRGETE